MTQGVEIFPNTRARTTISLLCLITVNVTVLMASQYEGEHGGRYLLFRKKPPKSKNGIMTGGPIARAMETLVLTHEMR
jgi:hypothetical protein